MATNDLAGVHVLVVEDTDDSREMRRVKTVAQTRGIRIPAIAITAYRGRREELLAEESVELVEKPLDPIALCGTIRRHVSLQT